MVNNRHVRFGTEGLRVEGKGLLRRIVRRFRGGLVFKTHRLLYHSTLGSRAIKKKKKREGGVRVAEGQDEGVETAVGKEYQLKISGFEVHYTS